LKELYGRDCVYCRLKSCNFIDVDDSCISRKKYDLQPIFTTAVKINSCHSVLRDSRELSAAVDQTPSAPMMLHFT
jgi:hypothetical protein